MRHILSTPESTGPHPLLVFLHGYDEGAPTELRTGMTRHGPLRDGRGARDFIVLAPQMPVCGDFWVNYADEVKTLALSVPNTDPSRYYLTGFSFGANGVFDLLLAQPELWAAAWAVDPTRVPVRDPGVPLWLSIGGIARRQTQAFLRTLPDCRWRDEGLDHVATATSAYRDEEIYSWLLGMSLSQR